MLDKKLVESANRWMVEDYKSDVEKLNQAFDRWTGQSAEWSVNAWNVSGDTENGVWVFDPEDDDDTFIVTHRTLDKETEDYEYDDKFQGTADEVIAFVRKNME